MSLALSTLIYEWRRYSAAIVALSMAGLLIMAVVGMFAGIGKSFTATIDRSPAHIFILPKKAESLFGSGGQPRRIMPMIYQHPEVVEVMDLDGDGALWQSQSKLPKDAPKAEKDKEKLKREFVQILTVDPVPGAVTLPTDFTEEQRLALQEPFGVLIDRSTINKLGADMGQKATLNGKTVKVVGILQNYPNVVQPMVVMSRQTARLLSLTNNGRRVGPLMVKIKDPSRDLIVRDELNAIAGDQYRAWTRKELSDANQKSLLKDNFIGIMLNGAMFFGGVVGIVITWQTLRGAIFANIKEFASLRALGVPMGKLRLIIMELSFWVGVAGLIFTFCLVNLVGILAGLGGLPMVFPLEQSISVGILLMIVSIMSGVFSLGVLNKGQPMDLLR